MAVELNQLIQNLETYGFILNTKTVNYNEFINSIINDTVFMQLFVCIISLLPIQMQWMMNQMATNLY